MMRPADSAVHLAVVGGGITGLAVAWYLRRESEARGRDLRITVLESSDRWGGKIVTEKVGGPGDAPFVVEGGPDSFLTQKPWALELSRELGLEDRLLNTNDSMRRVFVLNHGRPTPLPDGVLLIVPTRILPFALSPLLSPLAKLRMGADLIIPPKRDGEDETIAEFITRRLGREALDKIAEPLMSGIYNAEAEKQSLLATFPRFRALEVEHGSLIRGMLASRKAHRPSTDGAPGRKPSMFTSLVSGTSELADALVDRLGREPAVDLRLGIRVESVERAAGERSFVVRLAAGPPVVADAVVLCTPSTVAARLASRIAPEAATMLEAIRYVSTGTISVAFRRDEIAHPLDGFGLVIPRSERRPINAITWTSTKFDHRAPPGFALLRVFFGGSRHPEMMRTSDEELLAVVRSEFEALMGIDAAPVFHRIYRWFDANPQYDKGHLDRVSAIEAALPPGLYATGSAYRGIGIPDCVHQARETAKRIVSGLHGSSR